MSAPNSRRNLLLWLLFGAGAVTFAWQLDGKVDAALLVAGKPSLQKLARWCSEAGEGWAVAIWGILCAAIFFLMKRPETAAKIFFTAVTAEIAGLVSIIIRAFVGRARPNAHVPQGIYGVWHDGHWIIGKYDFSSFPSGHSAVAAVYALAVMWSRIAQGVHHLSDVTASIVLAVPVAMLMKKHFAWANGMFFEKLACKSPAGKPPSSKF